MQRLLSDLREGAEDGALALREQLFTVNSDLPPKSLRRVVLVIRVVGQGILRGRWAGDVRDEN